MPHLSKKELPKEISDEIEKNFVEIILKANSKEKIRDIFLELLTPVEKVMLAKRLAVILLIDKKVGNRKIMQMLNVSPSTVAKMIDDYKKGKYLSVSDNLKLKKMGESILDLIDFFISGFGIMPPMGKNRWKGFCSWKSPSSRK